MAWNSVHAQEAAFATPEHAKAMLGQAPEGVASGLRDRDNEDDLVPLAGEVRPLEGRASELTTN